MATKKTDKKSSTSAKSGARGRTATKSTKAKTTKSAKSEPKAAKPKPAPVAPKARHPRARVLENHGSKEALAKSLAAVIAKPDEDTDQLEVRLRKASNAQLLRLSRVTATVKQKYGNRDALIAAIGDAGKKSKDKNYMDKLATYSLPQLLDLANAAQRRARA